MTLIQRATASNSEFVTRLAVTLGALAVYSLGAHLPLPGVDLTPLLSMRSSLALAERVSVFALGVSPIISIMLLVEIGRLVSKGFNDWAYASPANARRLDHYVLIGSVLLAAVQGYGLATALEAVTDIVAEPGLPFRLAIMVTVVASTAMIVWLAAAISRYGLGSGVWILLLVPSLGGLPKTALLLFNAVQAGIMSGASVAVAAAVILIALAIIVMLALAVNGTGMPLDRTLIWPLYIAVWMAGALGSISSLLPAGEMGDKAVDLLHRGAPLYLAVLAVLVIVVSLWQWRRSAARLPAAEPSALPKDAGGASPILITALILATLAVLPEILTGYFGVPVVMHLRLLVVLVVVALPILDWLRRREL
jgi:preprotein translocase subunit SecY